AQFDRWVYASGKKLSGLVKRRAAERALFEGKTPCACSLLSST
ncbi:lysozyme, partial [Deltaproteobacteria bacterium PRO3]|nr:lysozyme [Deltaproteobacteria bacterium PRO3]